MNFSFLAHFIILSDNFEGNISLAQTSRHDRGFNTNLTDFRRKMKSNSQPCEWKTHQTSFQLCHPPSILLPTIPVHLCKSTITCLNLYSAISCCVSWVGDMRQCCRCQTKSGGGTLQNYCTATATAPVHQCSGGTLWCTEDAKLLHNSAQQGGERSVRAAIHCTTVRL